MEKIKFYLEQCNNLTCANVYESWKKRCRLIHEREGSHVEQVKNIDNHKHDN